MSAAIRVRSREGQDVPWPAEAARRAGVLAGWMRETDADGSFLVPMASAAALHALAALCTQDSVDPADVATHSFVELAEIIHAAHFLEATAALDAASSALCARLRGKTTGELRLLLGVHGGEQIRVLLAVPGVDLLALGGAAPAGEPAAR